MNTVVGECMCCVFLQLNDLLITTIIYTMRIHSSPLYRDYIIASFSLSRTQYIGCEDMKMNTQCVCVSCVCNKVHNSHVPHSQSAANNENCKLLCSILDRRVILPYNCRISASTNCFVSCNFTNLFLSPFLCRRCLWHLQ